MSAFGKPIFDGRLTKRVLFALPEGAFLLSNCCFADKTPVIAEWLPTPESREVYWGKLREKGLPGTLFYAFASDRDYRAWLQLDTVSLHIAH